MLAVVECIELEDGLSDQFKSLGLARLICCFSSNVRNGRRAQAVLFSLLIKLLGSAKPMALAENCSGEGLLDGIFAILHNFNHKYLCQSATNVVPPLVHRMDDERDIFSSKVLVPDLEAVDQDRAACLCALKVLASLAKDERNHGVIVSHRFFMPLCFALLRSSKLPRPHLVLLTEVVRRCDGFVCAVGETGVFQGLVNTAVSRLEQACGFSEEFVVIPASHLEEGCVDYSVSENLLAFLTTYSAGICVDDEIGHVEDCDNEKEDRMEFVERLVHVIGKILKKPETVADSKSVINVCINLVGRVGGVIARERNVVIGLMECLGDNECVDIAAECLKKLHCTHGLDAFQKEFADLCGNKRHDVENTTTNGQCDADESSLNGGQVGSLEKARPQIGDAQSRKDPGENELKRDGKEPSPSMSEQTPLVHKETPDSGNTVRQREASLELADC